MLSSKEFAVLRALIDNGEKYGLELVRESDGVLKRGTIYVLLERMTDKGYVESRQEKNPTVSGLPRRLYKPTGLGERVYEMTAQWNAELAGGVA